MKARLPLLLVAVMATVSGPSCGRSPYAPDAIWKEHTSAEGRFSAAFPGEPTRQERTLNTCHGCIPFTMTHMEHGKEGMGVAYCDFPKEIVRKTSTEKLFDGVRDGAVVQFKGLVIEDRMVNVYKATGREITIKIKDDLLGRARMLMVDNRLYLIQVTGSREQVNSDAAKRFFNSFTDHLPNRSARK